LLKARKVKLVEKAVAIEWLCKCLLLANSFITVQWSNWKAVLSTQFMLRLYNEDKLSHTPGV
jgi:hypothetical protein